jgi:hypothetical protein
MKRLFILLTSVLVSAYIFSQAPQKMSYQAVVRNSSGALIKSSPVGMRISVLQGGAEVYKELFNPNPISNENGLVTIEIGNGIPLTGTFASINWMNGPSFIKTEIDPTGGTNYNITGSSQLLSVPSLPMELMFLPGRLRATVALQSPPTLSGRSIISHLCLK